MSAQALGKGRKTKTAEIADGLSLMEINPNDMSDTDLKSVLDAVVMRPGGYKSSKSPSSEPGDLALKLLQKEKEKINREEDKFGSSLMHSMAPKHSHSLPSSLKSTTFIADDHRGRENDSKYEENHRIALPQVQQSLGSAGSSKASSNASDESEEMDASGMNSNYDSMHEFGLGQRMLILESLECQDDDYANNFQRNYHHDMHAKENGQNRGEGSRGGRSHQYNGNNGDRSKVSNRGYDEEYRQPEYQGSTRMSFSHNPQLSSRHNGNRGGSQSDPQPYQQLGGSFALDNGRYLEKKKGRSEKLKKLSKYQSKKTDVPNSSHEDKAYENIFDAALAKTASLDGIALLDYIATEKQKLEKTEASKKLLHSASAPTETSPGSRNKKKSSPDGPSKGFSSMSPKNGVARGEGGSQKARKAKVSDTESSHGSDQEMAVDAAPRSTRLPTFPKHSRSLNLDASPETPVSYSITQQAGWENDIEAMERDDLRYTCSPTTNGELASSSGRSSHSSDDVAELKVGAYVRLGDVEADVDDADKQEAVVVGKIDKLKKKKKKKSKKKKASPEQSKGLPTKESSLPSSPSAPIAVGRSSSPLSSIPNEQPVVPPRPETPAMAVHPEQPQSNEQPPETEFQVVTRRVSAKTSPTKSHSTPHNYPAPNRQSNVRNRMSQPPPRISKQPAVAVVPVTALEFPTLRRRNSAGDIKKGVADHVEDIDTGNVSDAETVASMPVLNKKKGSKTTSAPATRLPTPGISYADIAKGTPNGGSSHNNSLSDTHAVDSSPEKTVPKDGPNDSPKSVRSEKVEAHESRETQTGPVQVAEVHVVQVQSAQVVTATEPDQKPKDGPNGHMRPNSDLRSQQQQQQQFRPKNYRDFAPRGPPPPLHSRPPLLNGPPPPTMHQNSHNQMQQPRHLVARQSFNNGRLMAPPPNFSQAPPHHQGINLHPLRFNQPPMSFQYSQGHSAPARFLGGPVMQQVRGVSPPAQPFLDPRTGQPLPHPQVFHVQPPPPPPRPPPRPELASRMYQVLPPDYNADMWPNGPPMPVQMIGAVRQEPPPAPHNYAYPTNDLMYGPVQSFYPDIGCSHNVSTHHTHMELMRRMKPAPPLAHLPGPGIYPRSRVNVPPPPPPPIPEEDNPWVGKKSMIFRNSQQPIYVEPEVQNVVPEIPAQPEVKRGDEVQQPMMDVQDLEQAQEAPKMIPRSAAEICAFMKERFEAARQKCIEGAPGCTYYRP
ncbi:hypothetical protein RvY_09934 [Ramazzottius varieornatus]|uniref:Uncharacterized protein n=1 Tax=Ramazzottius varieornatus TaxID=947166 RepID=A0A1D1VDG5_RAMVA|nr:hypothetical protein RvY_09934 [Ramazzottius varieornatus]